MDTLPFNEKYLVDKEGQRLGVFLTIQEYRSLLSRLDELENSKASCEQINIVDQILADASNTRRRERPHVQTPSRARWHDCHLMF